MRLSTFKATPYEPYVIAEIGIHHNGSCELACIMATEAAKAGASAIKLQHYTPELLCHPSAGAFWDTEREDGEHHINQLQLYRSHKMLNAGELKTLKAHCETLNIDLIITGFSLPDIDLIDDYVDGHKIASCDITNIPLLRHINTKNKPVILSTGASTISEISTALNELKNCPNVILLHCVLIYPTPMDLISLECIEQLLQQFPHNIIGYSDHSLPNNGNLPALIEACQYRAIVLEKHFTLTPGVPGSDHYHSMTSAMLENFIKSRQQAKRNCEEIYRLKSQQTARDTARRCICASMAIASGEKFTTENLITLRPASLGVSAEYWDKVIGQQATTNYEKFQPITGVLSNLT